jgi:hypothetical protein
MKVGHLAQVTFSLRLCLGDGNGKRVIEKGNKVLNPLDQSQTQRAFVGKAMQDNGISHVI